MKATVTTFDKYYTAQDVMSVLGIDLDRDFSVGLNYSLWGLSENEGQGDKSLDLGRYWNGYSFGEKLKKEGKVYFQHYFGCECGGNHSFEYGGFTKCYSCNRSIDRPRGWNIKVMPDGNKFCCVGEGFTNLQESNNYAFGDTFEDAIFNYRTEILKP